MINSFSQVASQFDLQVIEYPMDNIRRADNIPDGIRYYVDAAWDNGRTGLGIFFHDPQNHSAIFIQASSNKAQSALQVELTTLYLALQIAMFLNFLGVTFLTENATIVDTAKKGDSWRNLIISSVPTHLIQVKWIPRELKKMADKLAKDAKSSSRRDLPILKEAVMQNVSKASSGLLLVISNMHSVSNA
uniref:RNase H type-1 domain-containing protein n=1 Tax=Oryza meridionalis TaxID=40149 RepID=A0A0E0EPT2_9ORYZ